MKLHKLEQIIDDVELMIIGKEADIAWLAKQKINPDVPEEDIKYINEQIFNKEKEIENLLFLKSFYKQKYDIIENEQ